MSQLLPYLGVASLLLVVSALWARQLFLTRKSRIELIVSQKRQPTSGSSASHRDHGERIFDLGDWDFVSRNAPSEIQEMFLRERAILAISWLRRTRARISLVMRAHVAAVGQIDDLHLATELKLALSYLVVLTLCDLLIAWIWLRGPVRTRKMVGRTLRTMSWLRGAFEQLMARVSAEI
ncbi:MAG: hypothetical protein DMG55_00860 [Acidobacteria bacterium]|nr:MAG: hypothetical protein DMG55_00860 [Acidobacteriota bacterium]